MRGWCLLGAGLIVACGDDSASKTGEGGGAASTSTSSTSSGAPASSASSTASSAGSGEGAGGSSVSGAGGAGGAVATGTGGEVPARLDGERCEANDECVSGLCLLEELTGYPGGLCASPCIGDSECDGLCRATSLGGACFPNCFGDTTVCREGLVCKKHDPLTYTCEPGCQQNDDCVATGVCDPSDGRCVPPEASCEDLIDDNGDGRVDCADPSCSGTAACEPGSTPLGGPCERHADCESPTGHPMCLSEELTGFPGGACVQFCASGVDGFTSDTCVVPGFCDSDLVFSIDPGGSNPVGHCPITACDADNPCRAGYTCCESGQPGCAYVGCLPACTDDAQCVDTGRSCESPQAGWPELCAPPLPTEDCSNAIDDNDDYDADCEDDECLAFCTDLAASLCASAPALETTQQGETVPGPGIGDSCIYPDVVGTVSPQIYRHVAGVAGTLRLSLTSVYPQVVSVVAGCDLQTSQPVTCSRDDDFDGAVAVEAEIDAGATYFVLVWPAGPGHEDTFTLDAELP